MIGNNEIKLCGAEMNRAVEYYLNEVQLKEPVSVVEVSEIKSIGSWFIIKVHEYMPDKGEVHQI